MNSVTGCYYKFKHIFLYAINPLCSCSLTIENTVIASSTDPTFPVREIPFSVKSQLLTDELLTKTKSKLFKLSFMAIPYSLKWKHINSWCKYKVDFGSQKIWRTNFLGKRVAIKALLSKRNNFSFYFYYYRHFVIIVNLICYLIWYYHKKVNEFISWKASGKTTKIV